MTPSTRALAPRIHVNRRDTLSAVLVCLVTAIALLGGYLLRISVESRTASLAAAGSITVDYPDTWVVDPAPADGALVRLRDIGAAGAPTTFELRVQPVDAAADQQTAMAAVANDLALTRARDLPAFRLLGIDGNQQIKGLPGARSSYVFVETPDDTFGASLPVVVLGKDELAQQGDQIYIFTLHAAEENYERALQRFERFVATARLP